jgi:hypothetical protein
MRKTLTMHEEMMTNEKVVPSFCSREYSEYCLLHEIPTFGRITPPGESLANTKYRTVPVLLMIIFCDGGGYCSGRPRLSYKLWYRSLREVIRLHTTYGMERRTTIADLNLN